MSLKEKYVVKKLKERYGLFKDVDEHRLLETLPALRIFELHESESLGITGSYDIDLLYIAMGMAQVTLEDGTTLTLDNNSTRHVPIPPFPGLLTIKAIEDSYVCHVDVENLSFIKSMDSVLDVVSGISEEIRMYMDKLHNSPAFSRIPLECYDKAVKGLKLVKVKKGEELLRFKEEAEAFYIIASGRAEVLRESIETMEMEKTDELTEGDEFGEDAIMMGAKSPLTVRFIEDGAVLSLSREDFKELFQKPILEEVEANVAKAMMDNGCGLLDVRFQEEFEDRSIPGALLIPLPELRKRAGELDPGKTWCIYCRSGRRSAVAAFLLNQMNLKTVSVKGGISKWPYEVAGG